MIKWIIPVPFPDEESNLSQFSGRNSYIKYILLHDMAQNRWVQELSSFRDRCVQELYSDPQFCHFGNGVSLGMDVCVVRFNTKLQHSLHFYFCLCIISFCDLGQCNIFVSCWTCTSQCVIERRPFPPD